MFKKIGMFVTFIVVVAAITAGIMFFFSRNNELDEEFEEEELADFKLDNDLKATDDREYIPLS